MLMLFLCVSQKWHSYQTITAFAKRNILHTLTQFGAERPIRDAATWTGGVVLAKVPVLSAFAPCHCREVEILFVGWLSWNGAGLEFINAEFCLGRPSAALEGGITGYLVGGEVRDEWMMMPASPSRC